MSEKHYIRSNIHRVLLFLFLGILLSCHQKETAYKNKVIPKTVTNVSSSPKEYAVEAPPFSEGIFPCTECHAYMNPNPVRREQMDMHEDILAIFDHDSKNRWCLDCHDLEHRDSLRLASGKLIGFDESYKLCGQCHGEKLRDWKVGVHGKRTGQWNGKKEYLLCVHCHSPHSPKFKPLKPEPPPVRQEAIK